MGHYEARAKYVVHCPHDKSGQGICKWEPSMESYGAGLHDRPSLTKEIRLGEQELAHGCSQECVGRGKSSLKD